MMYVHSMALILCALQTIYARGIHHNEAIVYTKLGVIRGLQQKFENKIVNAYLGVPFAEPPVKGLRFSLPKMLKPWHGELQARNLSRTCYVTPDGMFKLFHGAEMWNPPGEVDEDCLALNIWVPADASGHVMVWIYGGGFYSGSPSLDLYNGTVLASRRNVIIVNVNYRLGPFGFLYFGEDSSIPGNMGLMDQQLALQWIHENIGAFGGDPNKVTIFGESAGAASVTAHFIAPGSAKYFQRAIVMSGTISNSWAAQPKEILLNTSIMLAQKLGCVKEGQETSVNRIAECVRQADVSKIQTAADDISQFELTAMTFPFVPVEEDSNFFQGNFMEKLQRREFKKDMSVLIGSMKDEGTYWLPYYLSGPETGFKFNHTISANDKDNQAIINKTQFENSLDTFKNFFTNSQVVRRALLHAYEGASETSEESVRLRDGVARFVGDFFFTCALLDFADMLADNIYGPVYMYYFTQRSSSNPWPEWMGVMHGYEIEYVFGQPFRQATLADKYDPAKLATEQKFSDNIMKYWTDFAVNGDPLPKIWRKYNKASRESLVLNESINNNVFTMAVDIHGSYCRLLDEIQRYQPNSKTDCAQNAKPFTSSDATYRSSLLFLVLLTLKLFLNILL